MPTRRLLVAGLRVGQAVATMVPGGFGDFLAVPAKLAMPISQVAPEVVALLTSGLTASIGVLQLSLVFPPSPSLYLPW
jgi:NADPH:quinone reductase-like Zn-dependent oxidoreductase